jgi:HEAT repeat protein
MNDHGGVPSLIAALDDPDEGVRAYAADALGRSGAAGAAGDLAARLAVEKSAFVKAYLLAAGYRLGDDKALRRLVELSGADDDTLAVTILNLAAELATPENAFELKNLIEPVAQARPALSL